jgi:hypothetical protein
MMRKKVGEVKGKWSEMTRKRFSGEGANLEHVSQRR